MQKIHDAVAGKLVGTGTAVLDKVVALMVEKKIQTRVDLVSNTLTEIGKLEKEFKKLKPDVVTFDETGKKLTESYTQAVVKQRTENRDRVNKLNSALEKALDEDNWEPLTNVSGNKNAEG